MSASRIRTVLEMIKFEHSVFALPFALTGALLAARATHQPPNGWPSWRQIVWIVVAMVSARSAAMTMNRSGRHAWATSFIAGRSVPWSGCSEVRDRSII